MKFRQFLFILIFTSQLVVSQTKKNVDHQSLLWTRYYNQLTLSNKWSIHTEFDNRIFVKPATQNLYLLRMVGRYKINENFETGLGFVYFSVATQDPEITYNFNIPEYRGQQDIIWKQDFGKFSLGQRFQIEERFIQNANKDELLSGTTFSWRFRYRIQADYTFWKKEDQFLKAILSEEIMINAGKSIVNNTFDQNRIYAAVQYGISKNIAFELGYLKSVQQRQSGTDYFNRDILRFTIFHKIKIKETKK